MLFAGKTWTALTLTLVTALLVAGCGGGGGGGSDDGDDNDLVLVKFALIDQQGNPTGASGTTNAYRNNRIRFTFSAPVEKSTVSDRTIQIGIPASGGLFLTAPGRFTTDGNVIIFDPSITATNAPRPFGFEADSVYSVIVRGLPDPKTLVSTEGKVVLSPFSTNFTTTDLYLPDLDQPRVLSVQPESQVTIPADRFSPEAEAIWVKSTADVVVEFSEAMNPATFSTDSSFTIFNTDRNREVFGVFRFSDDARTVTFRPTFGFGRGPYIIRVNLTVDLTDLAGNAISNPQQWEFLTEYDPTAVNEGIVEEYFDNVDYEDTSFVGPNGEAIAKWNDAQYPGRLESVFGVSTVALPANQNPTSGVFPPIGTGFWANARGQVMYTGSEVGQAAGTITQLWWRTYNSPYHASGNVWTGLTVQLGMTSRSSITNVFANNFNVGSPVTMASNVTYTVPTNSGNQYVQLPATKNFPYNGTDGLVLDIAKTSSSQANPAAWAFVYSSGRFAYGTPSSATSGTVTSYWPFSQFGFRTEASMAQSLWYKADSPDPMYLDPVVSPTEQPPGTEVTVTYSGTMDNGSGSPDPAQETAFTDDPSELDGYEYIRFRVKFKANLGTGVGPGLDDVLIPYIFF